MIFLFLSLKKVTISMITPVQEAYTEVFSVLRVVLCCFATTSQTLKSKHGRWKSSLSAQPLEVKPMTIRNNSVEIVMY